MRARKRDRRRERVRGQGSGFRQGGRAEGGRDRGEGGKAREAREDVRPTDGFRHVLHAMLRIAQEGALAINQATGIGGLGHGVDSLLGWPFWPSEEYS